MSMISGLIDELNKSADEWNSSNMFELARMCRDAADTIWQLRDDLQRTNAENAKLRNSLKALMMGTNVELCADRDASQCQECSMALDEHRCAMSDAMLLLGIDMYGESL